MLTPPFESAVMFLMGILNGYFMSNAANCGVLEGHSSRYRKKYIYKSFLRLPLSVRPGGTHEMIEPHLLRAFVPWWLRRIRLRTRKPARKRVMKKARADARAFQSIGEKIQSTLDEWLCRCILG